MDIFKCMKTKKNIIFFIFLYTKKYINIFKTHLNIFKRKIISENPHSILICIISFPC